MTFVIIPRIQNLFIYLKRFDWQERNNRGISDLKWPVCKIVFIMSYASKEDSGEPVHVLRLSRAFTAHKFKEMK